MNKAEFVSMSLPYNLWAFDTVSQKSYPIRFDKGCPECVCKILGFEKYKDMCLNVFQAANDEMIKPILRPLSDLNKEIEHNGDKFIPIEELGYNKEYDVTFYTDGAYFAIYRNGIHCVCAQGKMLLKLIEWHFDVADLISKGQAIDLNQSVNPYK